MVPSINSHEKISFVNIPSLSLKMDTQKVPVPSGCLHMREKRHLPEPSIKNTIVVILILAGTPPIKHHPGLSGPFMGNEPHPEKCTMNRKQALSRAWSAVVALTTTGVAATWAARPARAGEHS